MKSTSACVLLVLLSVSLVAAEKQPIFLKSHHIDTTITPAAQFHVDASSSFIRGLPEENKQFIIQLVDVTEQTKTTVEAVLGVPLTTYLPVNSFAVLAKPSAAEKAKSLSVVSWVGHFEPSYKLSPSIASGNYRASMTTSSVSGLNLDPIIPKNPHEVINLNVVLVKKEKMSTVQDVASSLSAKLVASSFSSVAKVKAVSPKKISVFVPRRFVAAVSAIVAEHPLVHWIEPVVPMTTNNLHARQIMHTDLDKNVLKSNNELVTAFDKVSLDGSGEIIGVGDSGLDFSHCFFHDDKHSVAVTRSDSKLPKSEHRKVAAYWAFMDDKDGVGGHGSHVCGSIAGKHYKASSTSVLGSHHGTAPAARFAFTDVGCTSGQCTCGIDDQSGCTCDQQGGCMGNPRAVYLPADLDHFFFPWAYKMGARVHSNSWGGRDKSAESDYDVNSAEVDTFVHEHPDFLPIFAAGNDGAEGLTTIGSPGTAKNALTVGASRNTHSAFLAGLDYTDWDAKAVEASQQLSEMYCQDENSQPCQLARSLTSEAVCCEIGKQFDTLGKFCCKAQVAASINADAVLFGATSLADFSGKGPTKDGRIKPDIVAPGDVIYSSRSHGGALEGQCGRSDSFDNDVQANLMGDSGTSMATPLTAGTVALVRQYFREGFYPTGARVEANSLLPSAALLKATVINGAEALTGVLGNGAAEFDAKSIVHELTPSPLQGFGRLALNSSLYLANDNSAPKLFVKDSTKGISSKHTDELCFTAVAGSRLRATLVWSDVAAAPSAAVTLVNDLDLAVEVVTAAGKKSVLLGNENWKKTSTGAVTQQPDRVNNVERVVASVPSKAQVKVSVSSYRVTSGAQPYAVVITGDFVSQPSACSAFPSVEDNNSDVVVVETAADASSSSSSSSSNSGSLVGIVVGSVCAVSVVAALTAFIVIRRRRTSAVMDADNAFVRL